MPAPVLADAQSDLEALSAYRGIAGSPFSFDITITASGRGSQTAKVLFRSYDSVLVDFTAPQTHVGRRILFAGSQMWMALPGSARPLRITPADRLLGEASIGDILNIDPSQYRARDGGSETLQGRSLKVIIAEGKRRGLLYPRVDFLVGAQDRPVLSRHYAQSGKLLKQASYTGYRRSGGGQRLSEMRLFSTAQQDRNTVLGFANYAKGDFPASWFNQSALHTPLTY